MGITKTLTLLLFFIMNISFSKQIQWMSLDQALKEQKLKPKKIIMDVYTKWCGHCRLLDKKTFGNPDVSRYLGLGTQAGDGKWPSTWING